MPSRKKAVAKAVVEEVDRDIAFTVMYNMLSFFGEDVDENIVKVYIPLVCTAFEGKSEFGVDPCIRVDRRDRLRRGALACDKSDETDRYVSAANEAMVYIRRCIALDRALWGIMRMTYPYVEEYDNDDEMKRMLITAYDDTGELTP